MYTLVTGATSDIGSAICKTLAEQGHKLLLSDIDASKLRELCQELPGEGHRYEAMDFSNVVEAKEQFVEFIKAEQIAISNAVFAAGIFAVRPLKMVDYDFCKLNFDIAVFSIIQLMQVLTSKRINGDNLSGVVLLSSISAKRGTKGYSLYSAVKSAMLGLMRSWAAEFSPRVRVNAVLPGGIRTRATEFIYNANSEIDSRYLLGEGKPNDIANAISFLFSDKARWITGQEFVVDGGWSIN